MTSAHLFSALCIVWAASEIWLGWRKRSDDANRSRDRGTLRMLLITIYGCLALGVWLAYQPAGHVVEHRRALLWAGLALMIAGLLLRWWSIRVLARFFTVDVAIRADHELIRRGPYGLLRHPSYTGALMTFYGFALALANVWSLLIIVLPVTAVFLWRIRVEERVLAEAFPETWPTYVRATKRLMPFVW